MHFDRLQYLPSLVAANVTNRARESRNLVWQLKRENQKPAPEDPCWPLLKNIQPPIMDIYVFPANDRESVRSEKKEASLS